MTEKASVLTELIHAAPSGAVALRAPDRSPLTYGGLAAQIEETGRALRALGIGAGDSVAIVIPNSPEAASSFFGVACNAAAAPLNSAYRADEFEFYLDDLDAKALIVLKGSDTPAIAIAQRRNIPILEITPREQAGSFSIDGAGVQPVPCGRRVAAIRRCCCTRRARPRGPSWCRSAMAI